MVLRIFRAPALAALLFSVSCVPLGPFGGAPAPGTSPSEGSGRGGASLRAIVPSGPPLEIRRVSVQPKTFDPRAGERATVRFMLTPPGEARIELRADDGEGKAPIRTLEPASTASGVFEAVWDGRDEAGRPVPPGAYVYTIEGRTDDGRALRYGDASLGAGQLLEAESFVYDAPSRTVRFVLPKAARVRLRMGLRGLPMMRTYYHWMPLEAGAHEIVWDGYDATRQVELARHPDVQMSLSARALPDNTLVVSDPAPTTDDPCVELCFQIEIPDAVGRTSEGTPIVSDTATIRLRLDPRDRARLVDTRFEAMFFLDTVFLFEEEDGAPLFNYRLDTESLSPGAHLITVNLLSYADQIGVQSLEFIKQAPDPSRLPETIR